MSTETSEVVQETAEVSVDAKILADLETVKEKMDLCENMLRPGDGSPTPSLKNNEALLSVIGFLEACGPRMVELVEAAAQGALSEEVLMECLSVNDRLLKLLSDIDTYAFTETPASTTTASAPKQSVEDSFNDLLLDDDQNTSPPPARDLLDLKEGSDRKMSAEGGSKKPSAQEKDDFDDFFAERTGTQG